MCIPVSIKEYKVPRTRYQYRVLVPGTGINKERVQRSLQAVCILSIVKERRIERQSDSFPGFSCVHLVGKSCEGSDFGRERIKKAKNLQFYPQQS